MESSKGLNTFESESMLGSLIFYAFIAILFFFVGRHYDRVTSKLKEQKDNKRSKYSDYQKVTKNKEDEEKGGIPFVGSKKSKKEKYLEKNLEESKMEVKTLSIEVSKLRQKEQNLNAENQILKSKVRNAQNSSSTNRDEDEFNRRHHRPHHRRGSEEEPISSKYEEEKETSQPIPVSNGSNNVEEKHKDKKVRDPHDEEQEALVNEIDTFLIEDNDL